MFDTQEVEFPFTNGTTYRQQFTIIVPDGVAVFDADVVVRADVKKQGKFLLAPLTALSSAGPGSPFGSSLTIDDVSAQQLVVTVTLTDEETERYPQASPVVFDLKLVFPSGDEGTPVRVVLTPIGGYTNG